MRVPSVIPNFRLIDEGITIWPLDVAVVSTVKSPSYVELKCISGSMSVKGARVLLLTDRGRCENPRELDSYLDSGIADAALDAAQISAVEVGSFGESVL